MGRLQRFVVATQGGPLRWVWAALYRLLARASAVVLTTGVRGASAAVRGSLAHGRPIYGLSDIDLAIVVGTEHDRGRVLSRWRRLARLPGVVPLLGPPRVNLRAELEAAAVCTALTWPAHTLTQPERRPGDAAVYRGDGSGELARLLERPGLSGPTAGWRPLRGPMPVVAARPAAPELPLRAWLELQFVWRSAYRYFVHADWPSAATMAPKLVLDSAAILLRLRDGRPPTSRAHTLEAAATRLPEERESMRRVQEWLGEPLGSGAERLDAVLPPALRLAEQIAAEIERALAGAERTDVALAGVSHRPALPHGELPPDCPGERGPTLPLADWRALVRPELPDETFVPLAAKLDIQTIGAIAAAAPKGPQPALRHSSLLLMPAGPWWRGALRSISAPFSDPVSAALLAGEERATFPDVPGWSIAHTARRAVGEHRAWLRTAANRPEHPGALLGASVTAARAALLHDSVRSGAPVLPLTAEATLSALAEHPGARVAAESAAESYRAFAQNWTLPDPRTVEALLTTVLRMPAYS